MKKKLKSLFILVLLCAVTFSPFQFVKADGVLDGADENYKPYLSLGADLSKDQKNTVLDLLGISQEDLSDFQTTQVTNADEHKYLDKYLSSSVIGNKAYSSVLVVKQKEKTGIKVTTQNITYCTEGMYRNALITAGLKDANVTVAGPFKITGTAALVGAMKAYSVMTGEELSQESMDAATDELVTTGQVAESTGDATKTEETIALAKQKIVEGKLTSKEDIQKAVEDAAKEVGLNLSNENKAKIVDLMSKISGLDLNIDTIKSQAKDLYDKLSKLDLSNIDSEGWLQKIGDFFAKIIDVIVEFFKGLFK